MTKTLYRAAWVLPVTAPPIRDGFVLVEDGVIVAVGANGAKPRADGAGAFEDIDLGTAVLCPGFINAHTHLELSHLGGAVPGDRGFVPWVEEQLRVRAERKDDDVTGAMRAAVGSMRAGGTAAVVDISNSLAAVGPLVESGMSAMVLHEILGFDPEKADVVFEQTKALRETARARLPRGSRVRIGVAAHAPHSLSRRLYELLENDGGVDSIHVAESKAEIDFLSGVDGEWRAFLNRRVGPGVPFVSPGVSPVRYLDDLGALKPRVLAVHCIRVDEDDAKILAARGTVAVLCPRSNEYLGNGVPPLAMLLGNGVRVAFGTDSLASCASLDVVEDARFLAKRFPRVPATELLNGLTRSAAQALGFEDLGEIRSGARAELAAFVFDGAAPKDPASFVLREDVPARRVA